MFKHWLVLFLLSVATVLFGYHVLSSASPRVPAKQPAVQVGGERDKAITSLVQSKFGLLEQYFKLEKEVQAEFKDLLPLLNVKDQNVRLRLEYEEGLEKPSPGDFLTISVLGPRDVVLAECEFLCKRGQNGEVNISLETVDDASSADFKLQVRKAITEIGRDPARVAEILSKEQGKPVEVKEGEVTQRTTKGTERRKIFTVFVDGRPAVRVTPRDWFPDVVSLSAAPRTSCEEKLPIQK